MSKDVGFLNSFKTCFDISNTVEPENTSQNKKTVKDKWRLHGMKILAFNGLVHRLDNLQTYIIIYTTTFSFKILPF